MIYVLHTESYKKFKAVPLPIILFAWLVVQPNSHELQGHLSKESINQVSRCTIEEFSKSINTGFKNEQIEMLFEGVKLLNHVVEDVLRTRARLSIHIARGNILFASRSSSMWQNKRERGEFRGAKLKSRFRWSVRAKAEGRIVAHGKEEDYEKKTERKNWGVQNVGA